MVQIDPATLTSLIVMPAFIALFLGIIGSFAFRELMRRGKVRVIFYDPDAGSWRETFQKLTGNEFTLGKGDSGKRYILDAEARLYGDRPTWVVHPEHGWNYRGPTAAQTVDGDSLKMRLAITNPGSYHKAVARNRARDALNANTKDDKWGWVPFVAIAGVVAIFAVLMTVAFIAWKISSGASGAA